MPRTFKPRPKCQYIIFTSKGNTKCNNGSLKEPIEGKYLCKVHSEKYIRDKWQRLDEEDQNEYLTIITIRNSTIRKMIEKVKEL